MQVGDLVEMRRYDADLGTTLGVIVKVLQEPSKNGFLYDYAFEVWCTKRCRSYNLFEGEVSEIGNENR